MIILFLILTFLMAIIGCPLWLAMVGSMLAIYSLRNLATLVKVRN